MKNRLFLGISVSLLLSLAGCKTTGKFEFVSPQSGQRALFGQPLKITMNFPSATLDSVVYSLDGTVIERKQDTSSLILDTKKLKLGDFSLTAKVYVSGKEEIAYSSVLILPPSPTNYGFEVVNSFPHDTEAFTQGLQYENGVLYESTGRNGESSLRKVELATGKVSKQVRLEDEYFGEGMTIVGDKIVLLTWQNKIGFFYNKSTFERTGTFNYGNSAEGWGLTYDGKQLIKSDGSNRLYFLDPATGKELSSIGVYDDNGAVDMLNELEYIDGKVYANIYGQEIIAIINPQTGAVEGKINLVGMYTENRKPADNELNGIAYDHAGKRLFVTGKLWSKLFEIKLVER